MSSQTLKGLGRRFVLIVAAAALMVGFGASSAFASIVITPSGSGPYPATGQELGVTVTAPGFPPFTEAKYVTVAECNLTGVLGKRCSAASGQPFQEVEAVNVFPEVDIGREFEDFDFEIQQPAGTETECFSWSALEGDPCGIVASYYKGTLGPGLEHIGSESAAIWFE